MVHIDNTDGQSAGAFKLGQYALANALYTPVPNVMLGPEGGWIRARTTRMDSVVENDHVQLSFKYSFATSIGGQ